MVSPTPPPTPNRPELQHGPATRAYIHGEWDNALPELPAADNTTASVIHARYGIAFLAVHRLEMKYGRASLIAPWSTIEADCIAYVKAF